MKSWNTMGGCLKYIASAKKESHPGGRACNPATLEREFRDSVGSKPVGVIDLH